MSLVKNKSTIFFMVARVQSLNLKPYIYYILFIPTKLSSLGQTKVLLINELKHQSLVNENIQI